MATWTGFDSLTGRYREQARSHMGSGVYTQWPFTTNPCGSELARDSGGSVSVMLTVLQP
ncbi:hypothetical protein EMIT0P228_160009 [Pseudomonas brassicacearum]